MDVLGVETFRCLHKKILSLRNVRKWSISREVWAVGSGAEPWPPIQIVTSQNNRGLVVGKYFIDYSQAQLWTNHNDKIVPVEANGETSMASPLCPEAKYTKAPFA